MVGGRGSGGSWARRGQPGTPQRSGIITGPPQPLAAAQGALKQRHLSPFRQRPAPDLGLPRNDPKPARIVPAAAETAARSPAIARTRPEPSAALRPPTPLPDVDEVLQCDREIEWAVSVVTAGLPPLPLRAGEARCLDGRVRRGTCFCPPRYVSLTQPLPSLPYISLRQPWPPRQTAPSACARSHAARSRCTAVTPTMPRAAWGHGRVSHTVAGCVSAMTRRHGELSVIMHYCFHNPSCPAPPRLTRR